MTHATYEITDRKPAAWVVAVAIGSAVTLCMSCLAILAR